MLTYFWDLGSGCCFKVMKNLGLVIAQDKVVRGPMILRVSAEAAFGQKDSIPNIFNLIFFLH